MQVKKWLRAFLRETSGAVTTEYVAVASITLVAAMVMSFQIMGGQGEGQGVAGLAQSSTDAFETRSNDIDNLVAKAGAFQGNQ